MADFEVDMDGMDEFRKSLDILERDFPKQAQAMLRRVGNRAAIVVRKKARELVRRDTGTYQQSIKRGRVWKGGDGQYYVRVYSKDPKQFLIEYGHRIVDKNGKEHGFMLGKYVFEKAVKEMEGQFESILVDEFNKILSKL